MSPSMHSFPSLSSLLLSISPVHTNNSNCSNDSSSHRIHSISGLLALIPPQSRRIICCSTRLSPNAFADAATHRCAVVRIAWRASPQSMRQAVSIYLEATPRSIIGDSIAEKQRFIAQVASLQGGLPPLCLHFRYHQLRQPSNSSSGTILSNCSLCISSVNESSIELRALEHSIVASSHMCVWSDDSSALLLLSGGSQSKADDVDERLQSGLTAGGPSTARRICAVVHALILELRLVAALYRRTALQRLGELRQNTSRPSGSAVMGPRIGMAVSAAACLQVTRQQQQLDILLADLLEWEWPWVID